MKHENSKLLIRHPR